jgi:hypothetical protein
MCVRVYKWSAFVLCLKQWRRTPKILGVADGAAGGGARGLRRRGGGRGSLRLQGGGRGACGAGAWGCGLAVDY